MTMNAMRSLMPILALALLVPAALQARSWTVMYYMVVDERTLESELEAVKKIPQALKGSDQVSAVLQWDTHKDDAGIYVAQQGKWAQAPGTVADNMGDPKTLFDFMRYAMTNYPARRYALVLGGHGSGFEDKWGPGSTSDRPMSTEGVRRALLDRIGRPQATPGHTKGTCYDYDDDDCLTLQESRVVIEEACRRFNDEGKLDLLAFSSCWQMNMEFLVEHAHVVDYVVGCETPSWTGTDMVYGFLDDLRRHPDAATREICKIMVEGYIKGAERAETVAWFETAGMARVLSGLDAFAFELLRMNRNPKRHGVKGANFHSVLFADSEHHEGSERFIDVTTLLRNVETGKVGFRVSAELASTVEELKQAFGAHCGSWHRQPYSDYKSWCVSAYLPKEKKHLAELQPWYDQLRISFDSHWDEYLEQRKGRGYDHARALAADLRIMVLRQRAVRSMLATGRGPETLTGSEAAYMDELQRRAVETLARQTALEIAEEGGDGFVALRDAVKTSTAETRREVAPLLRPVLQAARQALAGLADGEEKVPLVRVLDELTEQLR